MKPILTILAVSLLLAILPASVQAAPVERTCYEYPVKLRHVSCFAGWCSAWEDIHIGGVRTLTVRVSGWHLRNGMIRPVTVCR